MRDINPKPAPPKLLGGSYRRTTAAEGVKNHIAGVTAGLNDALKERQGLLRRVAEALSCFRIQRIDIDPNILKWRASYFVKIPSIAWPSSHFGWPIYSPFSIKLFKAFSSELPMISFQTGIKATPWTP